MCLRVVEGEIDYVANGWIPHIRRRLASLGGEIAVKDAWQTRIQRYNNDSPMEVINTSTDFKPREKRLANECQLCGLESHLCIRP